MMKSMTGYAYLEKTEADLNVSVEIKSLNSRYLDVSVICPAWIPGLEQEIIDFISMRFKRGKINAIVKIRETNTEVQVSINKKAAAAYYSALEEISKELDIKEKPGLHHILSLEGVLESEKIRDNSKYREKIYPVLSAAVDKFDKERIREGLHTKNDMLGNLSLLKNSLEYISSLVPQIEIQIKENIKSRFEELLGNAVDENRILAETAVLLLKSSINEELSRLSSHLDEFKKETEISQCSGKKLDFLCQEINREINTIGSKNFIIEISRTVVDMKNALENIKEQLRNVE